MASEGKYQPLQASAHDSDVLGIYTGVDHHADSIRDRPRFRFNIRRFDQPNLWRFVTARIRHVIEVGQPLVDSAEEGASQILPGRLSRIRGSVEDHNAAVDPNQGQEEIRRNTCDIGKTVDQKGPCRQRLGALDMNSVLGDLERLGGSPDAQRIGVLEDLRRQSDQRASPFDAF